MRNKNIITEFGQRKEKINSKSSRERVVAKCESVRVWVLTFFKYAFNTFRVLNVRKIVI